MNTRAFLNYVHGDLAAPRPQPYAIGARVVARRAILINDRGGECVLDEAPLRVRLTAAERDPNVGWRFTGQLYESIDLEKARRLGQTQPLDESNLNPALAQWYARARERFDPSAVKLVEWNIVSPCGAGARRPAWTWMGVAL